MCKPKCKPRLTLVLAARVVGTVTVAAATVSAVGPLTAQVPTARAYVEPAEVELGERFRVTVEVTGASEVGDLGPLFPLFWFADSPPDRAVPYATEIKAPPNEETGGSVAFSYSLVAKMAGSFEMGPFELRADGRKLQTEPVTLVVTVPDPGAVSVRARLDRTEVQVMEELELTVDVTPAGLRLAWPELPDFSDFATWGGSRWRDGSMVFKLVASAPGTHEIGPLKFKVGDDTFETEPVTLVVTGDAPTIEAHASLNTEQTGVGSYFLLMVEVPGADEFDSDPVLPDMSAFAETPRSGGSGWSSDGFRPTVRREYRIRAVTAGEFEIGPVRVMAAGQTLLTEPLQLIVNEASPATPAESPKDLRATATADLRRVYVGQPVIVTYRLLARDNRMSFDGWWVENVDTLVLPVQGDFQVMRQGGGVGRERFPVDGRLFRAASEHPVGFFPLEAGRKTIGSAVFKFQIHQRDRAHFVERSRAQREGTWTPATLTTDSIPIEVVPLPAEGRPESFRGYVGRLDLVSRVDRTDMEVGDTLTLRVEVSRDVHSLAMPEPEIAFPTGFEVIEQEMDDPGSGRRESANRMLPSETRVYSYRLVATREGSFRIPSVEMSWFDPESESYGTARSQPFDLTVVGTARNGGG